jgi:serine/threonine protein kinase
LTLATGTRLGPYEILSPLGAGGMGEVYRAKDTRLGRDVAVKVLPSSFSQDAERLRRFDRRTYPGRMNTGRVGPAFLAIQGLLEPEKRHAAEEQTVIRTVRDESGGEPTPE